MKKEIEFCDECGYDLEEARCQCHCTCNKPWFLCECGKLNNEEEKGQDAIYQNIQPKDK